jgi:hypothetical protein
MALGKRCLLILVLGGIGFASDADAQLFGERNVGRPVARRPGAANAQNAPAAAGPALESIGVMVDESARYVRGNRAVTDFVGSDSLPKDRDSSARFRPARGKWCNRPSTIACKSKRAWK